MKKVILIFLFNFLIFISFAQVRLSKKTEISLLTVSHGDQLYNMFGHSAIRVRDSINHIDWIFNYGTFDFNAPHFYLNFVKGYLNFMLSIDSYQGFKYMYTQEKRWAYEQVLNLSYRQKMKIVNFLLWNAQEKNRYYQYDFLYDNCATRARDVIYKLLKDSLVWNNKQLNLTFRDLINLYGNKKPWILFGINFLGGRTLDQKLDLWHAMFLPIYVDSVVAATKILLPDGTKQPLVKKAHYLFYFDRPLPKPKWYRPVNVFFALLILLLIITYFELKNKRWYLKWFDLILIGFIGFAGFLLIFMWLWSEHYVMRDNLNILWAMPLHLIYVFYATKGYKFKLTKYYPLFFAFYHLVFVAIIKFLPQGFDPGVIPLNLIVALRFYRIWLIYKQKQNTK